MEIGPIEVLLSILSVPQCNFLPLISIPAPLIYACCKRLPRRLLPVLAPATSTARYSKTFSPMTTLWTAGVSAVAWDPPPPTISAAVVPAAPVVPPPPSPACTRPCRAGAKKPAFSTATPFMIA